MPYSSGGKRYRINLRALASYNSLTHISPPYTYNKMAPHNDEADSTSETHHNANILKTIKEDEVMDETATTRHEPLNIKEDEYKEDDNNNNNNSTGGEEEIDVSLRLHRKVAEIAAKAYRRASEQSNVLSKAKLDNIALIKFNEIEIGTFLGKGSFSNVHEITKITATDEDEKSWDGKSSDDDEKDSNLKTDITSNTKKVRISGSEASSDKGNSIIVQNPRELLTMHHQRVSSREGDMQGAAGTYRYAIKYLKEEIRSSPQKYAVGTADLVVEGMFLASLAHPNIIKVRGLPEGGVKSLTTINRSHGYFLILDRLFNTLSDEIYKVWKCGHLVTLKRKVFGILKSKKEVEERNKNLAVRLKVAFDISAALKFLHGKNIIYRDLKPENLGFDVRGDIKLFDLGLVKELHQKDKDSKGNWRLSMAGTPRYMAPECGMYQPYNLSADVYSFSMLLWEIMTLEKPLKDFTYTKLKNEIFIDGERPPIKKVFNKKIKALISAGWSQNPKNRPTIDEVYDELKSEYLFLSPKSVTEGDVNHNRRRSTYVAKGVNKMSVRHLVRLNSVESSASASGRNVS